MVIKSLGNAMKKMSQRAMWRGDRAKSSMIESHGILGMRSNILNDLPTYKKSQTDFSGQVNVTKDISPTTSEKIGDSKDKNTNTKIKISTQPNKSTNSLGGNILDSVQK